MSTPQDNSLLYFLGRRTERLIFSGILLIVLCFVEAYLTAANRQLSEDRTAKIITVLQQRLELEESHLSLLYEIQSDPRNLPTHTITPTKEQHRSIIDTRKKLGLPLSNPPKTADQQLKPQSYSEALNTIIEGLSNYSLSLRSDYEKYIDRSKSPRELIKSLKKESKTLENAPTTVWGIQTPRIVQLQYAGLDYKFPYEFISGALGIALAPWIVGWLGALYMTRQRELVMIAAADDYKLVFPYILNFLPVNFHGLAERLQKNYSGKSEIRSRRINRTIQSTLRAILILTITVPLLAGFAYSLFQFWIIETNSISILLLAGLFMFFIMVIQVLFLVVQELVVLHGKEFYE